MKSIHNRKGFTLIELLVVIAIIGILASVILASLNTARAKARDAQRLSDLREVQKALEMYYDDHGAYPIGTVGTWRGNCSGQGGYSNTGPTGYIPNLAPQYISVLPLDPKPAASLCYIYQSTANGSDYSFVVYGTVEGAVPDSLKWQWAGHSYVINTPGGAGW